jgi:hypothetical protein
MDAAAQAAAPAQGGADAQQGQGSRGCDGVSVAENLAGYLITRKGVENTNSCRKRATATKNLALDLESGETAYAHLRQL